MLAAERRYELAADQVVRCVNWQISEQLLTAELLMNRKDGLHYHVTLGLRSNTYPRDDFF
jgi:hypothetical protein